jgi:murein DD-endopeptidase MepM/ murein hydrolase activator NlpD
VHRFWAAETVGACLLVIFGFAMSGRLGYATSVRASGAQAADAITIQMVTRAMQPGELVVFTINAPASTTAISLRAFDRETAATRRDRTTWVALAGIDLSVAAGDADVIVTAETPDGPLTATRTLPIESKRFPTRRLKVNPALVEPPADALPRIKREAERTNEIYGSPASSVLWDGLFVRPVDDPANSRFGSRSIYNGRPGTPHNGADFLSPTGTPIKAPNAGRVRLAEDLYFSGNTVIVDHGLGLFSIFAHLSAFHVKEGDMVETGQVLGLVGATGRVTGPHLHWTVRVTGARVDPLSLLAVLGAGAKPGPGERPPARVSKPLPPSR